MSIATGLIAKLLLAVSVIPAAGYGGYRAYDHYNPTFHRFMENEGYYWDPIDGNLGSDKAYYKKRSEIFENIGGDWRCSQKLFLDIEKPVPNTENTRIEEEGQTGNIPNAETGIPTSEDYYGCIVADLGHPSDLNKKSVFLKWELALRSGDRGFIYTGFFSIGKNRDSHGNTQENVTQQSSSVVFEVKKESNKWNIKNGISWSDFFTAYDSTDGILKLSSLKNGFSDVEIKVVLPNKEEWTSNGSICALNEGANGERCPSSDKWTFKKYVGFWEKDESGEQAINAIKIVAKDNKNKEHLHDIWSQTDFDFSTSTQTFEDNQKNKTAWNGSISFIYDVETSKWKRTDASKLPDATEYLKAIYSPWAKKKGKWTEAEGVCYESNSRTLKKTDTEAQRLLKFCYQNKNDKVK